MKTPQSTRRTARSNFTRTRLAQLLHIAIGASAGGLAMGVHAQTSGNSCPTGVTACLVYSQGTNGPDAPPSGLNEDGKSGTNAGSASAVSVTITNGQAVYTTNNTSPAIGVISTGGNGGNGGDASGGNANPVPIENVNAGNGGGGGVPSNGGTAGVSQTGDAAGLYQLMRQRRRKIDAVDAALLRFPWLSDALRSAKRYFLKGANRYAM